MRPGPTVGLRGCCQVPSVPDRHGPDPQRPALQFQQLLGLGLEGFLSYPWAKGARKTIEAHFRRRLAALQRCTMCRKCEQSCPYGLPIVNMIEEMLQDHPQVIAAVEARGWANESGEWTM